MSTPANCSNCGSELREGAKFCANCGTPVALPRPTHCPNPACNQQLSGGEKFCPTCGTPIQSTSPAAATASGVAQSAAPGMNPAGSYAPARPPDLQPVPQGRPSTRTDLVAIASKLFGALRAVLVDMNQDTFVHTVREVLALAQPLADVRELIENYTYGLLLGLNPPGQGNPRAASAADAAMAVLPPRLQPVVQDMRLGLSLDFGSEKSPWNTLLRYDPTYAMISGLWSIPDSQLEPGCVQTMYEGFFIVCPNCIKPMRRFLEEEEIRIENGLYPQSITSELRRAHGKLDRFLKKSENEKDQKGDADWDVSGILSVTAPLSDPALAQQLSSQFAMVGVRFPFSYEPLGRWEQQVVQNMLDDNYDLGEVYSFTKNCLENASQKVQVFLSAVNTTQLALIPANLYILCHHWLTARLNMYGRLLNPATYIDVPYRQRSPLERNLFDFQGNLRSQSVEMEAALFPRVRSLYEAGYVAAKQQAQAKASQPQPSPQITVVQQASQPQAPQQSQSSEHQTRPHQTLGRAETAKIIQTAVEEYLVHDKKGMLKLDLQRCSAVLGLTSEQIAEMVRTDSIIPWLRNNGWIQ